jgi:hypothetical protein
MTIFQRFLRWSIFAPFGQPYIPYSKTHSWSFESRPFPNSEVQLPYHFGRWVGGPVFERKSGERVQVTDVRMAFVEQSGHYRLQVKANGVWVRSNRYRLDVPDVPNPTHAGTTAPERRRAEKAHMKAIQAENAAKFGETTR